MTAVEPLFRITVEQAMEASSECAHRPPARQAADAGEQEPPSSTLLAAALAMATDSALDCAGDDQSARLSQQWG